jgi:hypothetical protein
MLAASPRWRGLVSESAFPPLQLSAARGERARRWGVAVVLALALACLFATPAAAHYREACWVQFRLPWWGYWSETFQVVCDYHTGRELNDRAGRQEFASYKQYVIIGGGTGSVGGREIIIRIKQSLSCGFVAEAPCAEQFSHLLSGREEAFFYARGRRVQREWAICQPSFTGGCTVPGFLRRGEPVY